VDYGKSSLIVAQVRKQLIDEIGKDQKQSVLENQTIRKMKPDYSNASISSDG